MLVYGDDRRVESPHALVRALRDRLRAPERPRSEALVSWGTEVLIATGELLQGVLDAAFERDGFDTIDVRTGLSREVSLAAAKTFLAARANASFAAIATGAQSVERGLDRLVRFGLPDAVTVGTPEGYAYYAVYPEFYAEVAEELSVLGESWVIIGIRSIGTSLAPVVAEVLGTSELYFVRPTGHPYRRAAAFCPSLEQALLRKRSSAHYAIVDEGPGMSGSSFGAVADWLERHGIALDRIHFLPSHPGDLGSRASPAHLERWRRAHRPHVSFESYFDESRILREIFGRPGERLYELSAGKWRAFLYPEPSVWPPAYPRLERRKYLCGPPGNRQIAKFAGLGQYGRPSFERATRLYERGFIPQPIALRSGFLVSTWHDRAVPLDRSVVNRSAWLTRATDYLAFLHGEFHAPKAAGAPVSVLVHMATVNIGEGIGREDAERFAERWTPAIDFIAENCDTVAIDGRLEPWEWLVLGDGTICKTDALEHHADHGLVGCQDLAWDLAGLRIEHALSPAEFDEVAARVAQNSDYIRTPDKESFFAQCYLAYHLGYYAMAAESVHDIDPHEEHRLSRRRDSYAEKLKVLLAQSR